MREQILSEKIFVWHCFVLDINGCEDNRSQILHLLSREEAKGNATNNSCSKKVLAQENFLVGSGRSLGGNVALHSKPRLQNSDECQVEKSPTRLLKTQKKERNQILQKSKNGKEIFWTHLERQNSSKAVTTLNSGKTITLYSVRKRNCGHDCNNMHHVHVKFYSKTIIGKGCSRHKVLKNQNSLIQCLRDHTHNRFQFIF